VTDQQKLDEAIRRYLLAKAEIKRLRKKIAAANCPLNVGDRVTVTDGVRTYDGIVERIDPAPSIEDYLEPKPGAPTPWIANGYRLKVDGTRSQRSLSIPADAQLVGGHGTCRKGASKLHSVFRRGPELALSKMQGRLLVERQVSVGVPGAPRRCGLTPERSHYGSW
jgi:hypothetical protein